MNKIHLLYYYLKSRYKTFSSRDAVLKHQNKCFEQFKKNILSKSDFYKKYINSELKEFPIINKKIMMDNFNDMNTEGLDRDKCLEIAIRAEKDRNFSPMLNNCTVGLSSGTSGNKGLFVANPSERTKWAGMILGKLLPKSVFSSQKIAFFLRANNNLYESVKSKKISFEFYDLLSDFDKLIDQLELQKPDIIIAPAKILMLISKEKNRIGINPTTIISVAEVLDNNDKITLENIFGCKVGNIYQCTEGFLGHTCEHGTMHLNEDILIIEKNWLNNEKTKFSPIITDFIRTSQPIVRYELDDILTVKKKPCICGSHLLAIESIEGRCDDILKLKGINGKIQMVFPDLIRNTIIVADGKVEDYQVNQIDSHTLNIKLKFLDSEYSDRKVKDGLLSLFETMNIITPTITFGEFNEGQLIEKKRRVINSYKAKTS